MRVQGRDAEIKAMRTAGASIRAIMARFHVSRRTTFRVLAAGRSGNGDA